MYTGKILLYLVNDITGPIFSINLPSRELTKNLGSVNFVTELLIFEGIV